MMGRSSGHDTVYVNGSPVAHHYSFDPCWGVIKFLFWAGLIGAAVYFIFFRRY
jgi:hypothetical protein